MAVEAHPQWIARAYAISPGRDHLGLGSVSSAQILSALSPGINVLTFHPRYYSFYTFLLDEYWRRGRPGNATDFRSFYRAREFIFSVGAHLCDRSEHVGTGRIVGSNKTASLAGQQRQAYNTTYNYIKSPLGGYGLYYRSVMAEVGLIYPGGPGFLYPLDVPSEKGKEVAEAFRQTVGSTRYYRDYFDSDAVDVPRDVVVEYIRRACLCQLQLPDAPDRPVLLDAFLHQPNHHVAAQRRATFCLYLDLASQTQGFALTEDSFRRLLYFGATGDGASFRPRPAVVDTHRRWRLYQAREYYVFALNALWYYLCDWGLDQGGDVRPIPLAVLWQHLDAALDFDGLADLFKLPRPGLTGASSLASLLDWLQQLVGAAGDSFDGACTIAAPLHEHRLYDRAMTQRRTALADPRIMVAGMVVMLCLIYLRFGSPEQWLTPQWSIARMGADERLSVDGFLRAVRTRLRAGSVTVAQLARWLYEDYVIRQHQLVALSKLPENTFRFQRDGDRLRFYRFDNDLGFADARFEALSTALHELGLCGRFEWAHHALTPDGQRLLEEGDLA